MRKTHPYSIQIHMHHSSYGEMSKQECILLCMHCKRGKDCVYMTHFWPGHKKVQEQHERGEGGARLRLLYSISISTEMYWHDIFPLSSYCMYCPRPPSEAMLNRRQAILARWHLQTKAITSQKIIFKQNLRIVKLNLRHPKDYGAKTRRFGVKLAWLSAKQKCVNSENPFSSTSAIILLSYYSYYRIMSALP